MFFKESNFFLIRNFRLELQNNRIDFINKFTESQHNQ
jgi:hypothetical protein